MEIFGRDGLLAAHGESRVDSAEQRAMELLREPLGAVRTLEHAASENLFYESRALFS